PRKISRRRSGVRAWWTYLASTTNHRRHDHSQIGNLSRLLVRRIPTKWCPKSPPDGNPALCETRLLSVQRHRRRCYLARHELGESGVDANLPHFDGEAIHSSKVLYLVDVLLIEFGHRFCEMTKIGVVHDTIATQFDAFVDPGGKPLFEIVHALVLTEP